MATIHWKAKATEALEIELSNLLAWFTVYDIQVAQYLRCQRIGEPYDKDMASMDAEATAKQLRIRELRDLLQN